MSKRKRRVMIGNDYEDVAEEELQSDIIPPNFKSFGQDAIEKYNKKSHINSVEVRTSSHTWKNANGDVYNYTINVGDVRQVDSVLEKQKYTLAVADIPYGFNAPGSEYDEIPFNEQDILDMVSSFAKVTTSPMWRFVVIHSLQQAYGVMAVSYTHLTLPTNREV